MDYLVFDNKEVIEKSNYLSGNNVLYVFLDDLMNKPEKFQKHTALLDIVNNAEMIDKEIEAMLSKKYKRRAELIHNLIEVKNRIIKDKLTIAFLIDYIINQLNEDYRKFKENNSKRMNLNKGIKHAENQLVVYDTERLEREAVKRHFKELKIFKLQLLLCKSRFKLLILGDSSDFKTYFHEEYLEKTFSDFNIPRVKRVVAYKENGKYMTFFTYKEELRKKTKNNEVVYLYVVTHDRAKMKEIDLKAYDISTIEELLDCILLEMKEDEEAVNKIKKCKNCNKYFIAKGKQIYCNNLSPQNSEKTCRELSDDTKNDNEYYRIYRQYYKKEYARKNRSREFQEKSIELYEKAKSEKMDLEKYKTEMKLLYERLLNGKE